MKNTNLRSSLFTNYCFGAYVPRKKMCLMDIKGETNEISQWQRKYVDYGTRHEKHGIAEWVLWQKDMPKYILDEQESLLIPNWLNLDEKETISISSTPDGFNSQMDTILEVKCTMTNKSCKEEFDFRWLPQIFGQQMIANMFFQGEELPYQIKKTHLINFGEKHTKIYEIPTNEKFTHYLIELLEEYSYALLSEEESQINKLDEKVKELKWDRNKAISLVYESVVN